MLKTSYDKSLCQMGIVHIGYGAFHRAHQAVYIDDYMEQTGDLRWGIVAVSLRNEGIREDVKKLNIANQIGYYWNRYK